MLQDLKASSQKGLEDTADAFTGTFLSTCEKPDAFLILAQVRDGLP